MQDLPQPDVHTLGAGDSVAAVSLETVSLNCSQPSLQPRLEEALQRQLLLAPGGPSSGGLEVNIEVSLQSQTTGLDINTPERYTLRVARPEDVVQVTIEASNYYGARHGLETLFQLVVWDELEGNHLMLDTVDITDWPEFPHRGISVDTVRNFIPVDNIKTVKVARHERYNFAI